MLSTKTVHGQTYIKLADIATLNPVCCSAVAVYSVCTHSLLVFDVSFYLVTLSLNLSSFLFLRFGVYSRKRISIVPLPGTCLFISFLFESS